MPAYIWHHEMGYFVGEFLGLGFFEQHIDDGACSPEERPAEFGSSAEAQGFLDSWAGGTCGCIVTEDADLERNHEEGLQNDLVTP